MGGTHVQVRIGREAYAVPTESVVEIIDVTQVTPVPRAPQSLLGLTPVRGRLLPLLDLGRLLGVERSTAVARAMVAHVAGTVVALAVDAVTDVVSLPGTLQESEADLVEGAAIVGGEFVGVLALQRVLARATGSDGS